MSKKIEELITEGMRKAYKDGYRQGFRDGYDEAYAEQLEQLTPKSSGKISITTRKFKCTKCDGSWNNPDDAKNHSCKDHQQTS
jgi:hypothetical protein